jgi:Mce-associated membrane protein
MISTASKKTALGDSSEQPRPAGDGGDESLGAGCEKPAADPGDDPGTTGPDSADADATADTLDSDDVGAPTRWPTRLAQTLAYVILPAAALLLGGAAGYLKWLDNSAREVEVARVQSVHAAIDSTVAMLSYRPDTVTQNLAAARDRMTGAFRDSYTSLTTDVVIPGAKQRQISAVATVPAAASVTATPAHAVVLVFVNQTTTIGNDPPTETASRVKVTLDRVHNRWLISQFDPI